jgi:DMSO/TMAO reductase YedYZ molybdopterin-dependent catalytic subunit
MSGRFIKLSVPLVLLVVFLAVGCGGGATATTTATTGTPQTTTTTEGALEPIVVPTMPAVIPGYTELDPATGLHMTGTPTEIDLAAYRLVVTGKVDRELSLTYDDLRRLPKTTASPDLVCEGYFVDTATWSGVSLKTILEMAGAQPDAQKIIMKAADDYSMTFTLEQALRPENFLAYELEGQPVPVLHGFPVRAVIPGENGYMWVKWLLSIEVK